MANTVAASLDRVEQEMAALLLLGELPCDESDYAGIESRYEFLSEMHDALEGQPMATWGWPR